MFTNIYIYIYMQHSCNTHLFISHASMIPWSMVYKAANRLSSDMRTHFLLSTAQRMSPYTLIKAISTVHIQLVLHLYSTCPIFNPLYIPYPERILSLQPMSNQYPSFTEHAQSLPHIYCTCPESTHIYRPCPYRTRCLLIMCMSYVKSDPNLCDHFPIWLQYQLSLSHIFEKLCFYW